MNLDRIQRLLPTTIQNIVGEDLSAILRDSRMDPTTHPDTVFVSDVNIEKCSATFDKFQNRTFSVSALVAGKCNGFLDINTQADVEIAYRWDKVSFARNPNTYPIPKEALQKSFISENQPIIQPNIAVSPVSKPQVNKITSLDSTLSLAMLESELFSLNQENREISLANYDGIEPLSVMDAFTNDGNSSEDLNDQVSPLIDSDYIPEINQNTETKAVKISKIDDTLSIYPTSIFSSVETEILPVLLEGIAEEELKLFLRNSDSAKIEKHGIQLLKSDKNELYVVYGNQMKIVPLTIVDSSSQFVENLTREINTGNVAQESINLENTSTISIASSKAQSILNIQERISKESGFYLAEKTFLTSGKVAIQVVDERTSGKAVYPVIGVKVKVAGSEVVAETDATGHVYFSDLPETGKLAISIEDPSGYLQTTLAVVEVPQSGKVNRIEASRYSHLSLMQETVGEVQNAELGSLCVQLNDPDHSVEGYQVYLEEDDENLTYYYGNFGYLDRKLDKSSEAGRACFFNIEPGFYHVAVEGEQTYVTVPVQSYAGIHQLVQVSPNKSADVSFRLASVPVASEQLSRRFDLANRYRNVDFADIYGFSDIEFEQLGSSVLGSSSPLHVQDESFYLFQESGVFEPTLYAPRLSSFEGQRFVLPLFPQGFVEDLAVFSNMVLEPAFGHVVVEYGKAKELQNSVIDIELHSLLGEKIENVPFYYGEGAISKGIIFNIEPGAYLVVVKDDLGNWLASDKLMVYSDVLSFFRAGSHISYSEKLAQSLSSSEESAQ